MVADGPFSVDLRTRPTSRGEIHHLLVDAVGPPRGPLVVASTHSSLMKIRRSALSTPRVSKLASRLRSRCSVNLVRRPRWPRRARARVPASSIVDASCSATRLRPSTRAPLDDRDEPDAVLGVLPVIGLDLTHTIALPVSGERIVTFGDWHSAGVRPRRPPHPLASRTAGSVESCHRRHGLVPGRHTLPRTSHARLGGGTRTPGWCEQRHPDYGLMRSVAAGGTLPDEDLSAWSRAACIRHCRPTAVASGSSASDSPRDLPIAEPRAGRVETRSVAPPRRTLSPLGLRHPIVWDKSSSRHRDDTKCDAEATAPRCTAQRTLRRRRLTPDHARLGDCRGWSASRVFCAERMAARESKRLCARASPIRSRHTFGSRHANRPLGVVVPSRRNSKRVLPPPFAPTRHVDDFGADGSTPRLRG